MVGKISRLKSVKIWGCHGPQPLPPSPGFDSLIMYSAGRGIDGFCVDSPASILPFSLLVSSFLERMNEVATL